MANSNLPETAEFAEKIAKLCNGPAIFPCTAGPSPRRCRHC